VPSSPSIEDTPDPQAFNRWPAGKRLEWTFQCSLANLELVLSWDPPSLDREHLRAWKEVAVAVLNCGARIGLSRAKSVDGRALAENKAGLAKRDAVATAP
jgi:hypothetical protein